ncbi:ATP-dependent helicase [Candidatus Pacearchaeota archaeon]|nr:ATP-dependent helicase [Candidatus Pacearchaeota archaeon]|tara:strand:+ start:672 stop:3296 length:2625 start_codon:yes stop_codon:yes gene_type:complete
MKQEFEFIGKCEKEKLVASLDPLVKEWFFSRFEDFSATQLYGVVPIFERKSILVSAPTGGTKTLTAFLSILNYLVGLARKNELEKRIYAVYTSPLKALSNDIFVNLMTPLEEIEEIAKKDEGKYGKLQKIRVGLRTGDTSAYERQKLAKNPPHILVTTPESLAIMINSPKFCENFGLLEFVIVDEIHSLAENKRGVHLSLILERLAEMSKLPLTRIGLSATVAPLEKIAHFLVGEDKNLRGCLIAHVELDKKLDLEVLSPVDDFLETDSIEFGASLYRLVDKLIGDNKTTLIFTNTRAATERVVHNLKEHFPSRYIENIGAHHSSLSKDHRFEIEEKLRKGDLKVVVCSTSLELGIDIGYIDLVILLSSPKSVSRAMQRIGRAGHQLHSRPRGKFIVTDVDDMVESAIIARSARGGKIDKVHIPENALDVLAQYIYGMAISRVWDVDEMFKLIKKSYCYRNLTREGFLNVVSYLAGEYELKVRNVYSKIWYDPDTRQIGKRGKLARVIYMTNIGTIPDESFLTVVLKDGTGVGKLDEGFLERMKKGDVFVLGGNRYQFMYAKGMKVYVKAANEKRPTIPSWFSEMLPLSFDVAMSIGEFRRLVSEMFEEGYSPEEIKGFIGNYISGDEKTVDNIYNYFEKQFKYSVIPHKNRILIEEYRDGQRNYIIFHTLFGRRVNDALSRAVAYTVASARKRDVEVGINDNGFFVAGAELDLEKVEKGFYFLISEFKKDKKNLGEVLGEAIETTEVLKRRFRHCAGRGLMILRNYKGRVKSVGRQQMSSHFLLAAIRKKTRDFPILKEARREVLEDLMDIEKTGLVLDWIVKNRIKVVKKNTNKNVMSPFAINLILASHSDVIRMEDKIEFIKRVYAELGRG